MKPDIQFHRTVVRILQQGGYAVAKGDAQRVLEALRGQPLKTGRVLKAADDLGMPKLVPTRPRRIILDEAWRRLAAALPDRIPDPDLQQARRMIGGEIGRVIAASHLLGHSLADSHSEGCDRVRDLVKVSPTMLPVYEEFCFTPQRNLMADAYHTISRQARLCLKAALRDHADDLVNAMPTEHIDALATVPSFAQACEAIDPYLFDGGNETGPFVRTVQRCFDVETAVFFSTYVPHGGGLYERLVTPVRQVA
jgi:hypothetical protein